MPHFVVAIDGSSKEVPVVNGYPGARVGYCTVASVLVNLTELDRLDEHRPIDPVAFRKTEDAATIDAALPGCNVVTRDHVHREACVPRGTVRDVQRLDPRRGGSHPAERYVRNAARSQAGHADRRVRMRTTGCGEHFRTSRGLPRCSCDRAQPLYSTDALRIHERFRDWGSNGEAYGEVMQVWERILLVHLLRCLERRGWLHRLPKLAFFVDGPLAVFGHPAWLSASDQHRAQATERARARAVGARPAHSRHREDGTFVTHFEEIDKTETPGAELFAPALVLHAERSVHQVSDHLLVEPDAVRRGHVLRPEGLLQDGERGSVVADIPFLSDEQDTLADDPRLYPQLGTTLAVLDKLVSSRYPNALTPIVSANAQAAIPLHLGAKVLQQLARALVQDASP